ncbi:MAG: extradiol ring-cleavage dioxygenase [Candidatus Entotheonellia bacterium]
MAQIVLGLGTSHSPQLSTPPELWPQHGERDQRNNRGLLDLQGNHVSYEALLGKADRSIAKEITPEKRQARYDACQKGIARLGETLAQVSPDIVVMLGDDQHELFTDENMPAVLVYWGETILNLPRHADAASPSQQASVWAYGDEKCYPIASDLGKHLIESLIDGGFDVAHSRALRPGQGMGHAFSFVYRRIMHDRMIPTVPVMVNTYYPPNQPTPKRCYDLGRALRGAIEAWDGDARVAVVASGGLSHFVIDEELDHQIIKAMREKDAEALATLPRKRLNSGTSETRNWIATAGAVEHLDMTLIDYVPCYRTPAGTGCAMAFAQWL